MDNKSSNNPLEYLSFLEVARQGGFRKAAERLGLSKSVVSARVKNLESRLQTKLFQRSTRVVRLTAEGTTLLEECEKLAQQLRALDTLSLREQVFTGRLRISAPVDMSALWLAPRIFDFQRLHPTLRVELVPTNQALDFEKDGIDVSLRVNSTSHRHLYQQKLGTVQFGLFCNARSELAKSDLPKRIAAAQTTGVVGLRAATLKVQVGKTAVTMKQHAQVKISDLLCARSLLFDDREALVALPRFVVANEMRQKIVIDALNGASFDDSTYYLVSDRKTSEDARVASLNAFLREQWQF